MKEINLQILLFQTSEKKNMEKALNECIEDVTKGCGNVIEYASMLEKENARLNKSLRKNRDKKCIQK